MDRLDAWICGLKVGDAVLDCRDRQLAIKEIQDEYYIKGKWLREWAWNLPEPIAAFIDVVCFKLRFRLLWDRHLILEDDSHCSARNCCSQVK